jgi:hypothetical protein
VAKCLITPAFIFLTVCYVLLAPRERTKLTVQFVECVLLGYSAEHKSYHCWNLIARRMRTSRDVIFDESHPFYPHPITDASHASLVDHLSFLFFPDAPPAFLPLPRSTLPTSVSSAESSHVILNYTVKPLMTQVYNCRRACLSDAPTFSAELYSVGTLPVGDGKVYRHKIQFRFFLKKTYIVSD